jgi:uncharacterized membrane protein
MGARDATPAVPTEAEGKDRTHVASTTTAPPVIGERQSQDRRLTVRSSFAGPLPAPGTLAEYDRILPGLAREIVDQWKAETRHRHETVASMRTTDYEEMVTYYAAERRGQTFAIVAIVGLLAVAVLAIVLDRPAVGVAGLLTGGAAAIWAMRRRSAGAHVAAAPDRPDADLSAVGGGDPRRP